MTPPVNPYITLKGNVATVFNKKISDDECKALKSSLATRIAPIVKVIASRLGDVDGKRAIMQEIHVKPSRGRGIHDIRARVYPDAYKALGIEATFVVLGVSGKVLTDAEALALMKSNPAWGELTSRSRSIQRADGELLWSKAKPI